MTFRSQMFCLVFLSTMLSSCSHRDIKAVPPKENLDSLITVYEKAFAKDTTNYNNAMNLGEVYFKKARRSLEEYDTRYAWDTILARKDVYVKGARVLEKATSLGQENERPYEYLAKIYYDLYRIQVSSDMVQGRVFFWFYTDRTYLSRAVRFCRETLARDSDNTEMHVLMALMSAATSPFWGGVNDSLNGSVIYHLGQALRAQGLAQDLGIISSKTDRYRLILRNLRNLHLNDEILYLQLCILGQQLSNQTSYETVRDSYGGMPIFAKAYYLLGLAALWKSDTDRFLDLIEKACAVNPSSLSALGNLVVAKADADMPEEELIYFKEWLTLSPSDSFYTSRSTLIRECQLSLVDSSAYFLHLYTRRHDLGKANEYLTRLLTKESFTEKDYLRLIGKTFTMFYVYNVEREFGSSSPVFVKEIQNMQVKLCERGIQRFPNSVELRKRLASYYLYLGRTDDALDLLKETIDLCGRNISGRQISDYYHAFPKWHDAAENISYALDHDGTHESICQDLAREYFAGGEAKKAIEFGEKALRYNPGFYQTYPDMINFYCLDSQYAKALDMCDKMKKVFERWNYEQMPERYFWSRFGIFIKFRKYDKALELLDEVFKTYPQDIWGSYADQFAIIQKADSALVLRKAKAGNRYAQYMLRIQNVAWE